MDTTIAPTSTSGWELLARLARCAQEGETAADAERAAATLAALLAQHLPHPAGRIELIEDGAAAGAAAWGEDGHAEALAPLDLVAEGAPVGRLQLAGPPLDPAFAAALGAQLALLLLARLRAREAETAEQVRALVAANLERVGSLETPTLLEAVLTKAAPLVGVLAGAIYSADEAEGQLHLLAAGDGPFVFPAALPLAGASVPAAAAAGRGPATGTLAPGPARRRGANTAPAERPALALPLVAHERLTGVLALILPAAEPPARLGRLAALFAEQATLLAHNAQLFSQQQQRARELFVLYENSQEINTTAQIESMLNRATENIALALGADYCAVLLSDEQAPDTLRAVAAYSDLAGARNGRQEAPPRDPVTFVGAGALLSPAGRGEPQLIEDTAAVAAHNLLAAALSAAGCRSALVLPLRGKDQTVGLLTVGYGRARRPVSPAERNLAQVLAAQVATAILNRRLYLAEQQRAEELELLQRIAQRLNADLNLDETLDSILDGVRALRFSAARVVLYDPRDRELHLAAQRGLASSATEAPGLTDWIARHQRHLRIGDLLTPVPQLSELGDLSGLTLDDGAPARAYLGVPMRVGEELVGTLELCAARPNAFAENDARLLTIVAGHAAQALANATRYERADSGLRARVEQLRALQRVSSQLAITLSQEEILAYVLEQALRATGASRGLIALRAASATPDGRIALSALGGQQAPDIYRSSLDEGEAAEEDAYLVVETVGFPEAARKAFIGAQLEREAATAFHALVRREPELADELEPAEQAALRSGAARSALAAPIFYQAGVYGVVLLLADAPRAFDHDAVEFLRALTHQAAVGIGNAQRYGELEHLSKQLQRRSDMLGDVLEIGQLLRADRNLANLLEQVGYSMAESANFRMVLFCLTDPDNHRVLRPVSAAGIPLSELDRIAGSPLPIELATRYLDPRYRLGRTYFVPAEEAQALEAGFDTAVFGYSSFDDERAPGEWQRDDRLCVPLYATEGNLLGLVFVGDPQDRQRPTARSVEPLAIFADQAAIAIENYNLLRDADARAEQMTALFQVGTVFTSTTDIDTLLERVYQEIVAHLGTPSFFYIATYHPEREQVRFELFMRQGEINAAAHKSVGAKTGLTAHIIDGGQPLLVQDLHADPVFGPRAVNYAADGADVRSWLGVPLVSQGRVIGVLSVQDFAPGVFSERDRQFLAGLANQLAIAMERAALFRERERRINELNIINRIGQITSSTLDLEQMLRQTYDQLRTFLSLDSFFIFVYHEAQNEVVLSFQVDGSHEELDRTVRAPADSSLTERIIRTRRPLRFRDLGAESRSAGYRPISFGSSRESASWLGVPLLVGDGSVVGVIAVMSYTPNLYGDRELAFMTTVANQLALGVQNARLLAQAREQVNQLALLNRVSVLAGAETDVQRIYQLVVDAMADATGVDQARLVIYDRARGVAPVVAEHVPSGAAGAIVVPIADSPSVDWLDEHKRPLIAEDAQSDPLFVLSHATFRELDIRSIALVPILVDGEVIGAVGLDFVGRVRAFAPQDISLCQTIASQTSTAIARARASSAAQRSANALVQKVAEQKTLLDAARILSSLLRPQEVLDKLMELVSRQLNVTTVALWTLDGDVLVPAALSGIPAERGRSMRVPVGQGLTGRVAGSGEAIIIHDVNAEGGSLYPAYQRDNNLVSFMGVPVVYREQLVGVLSVMTNYLRRFTDDERALLEGLADQAATALENARLFEEREQRINELSTINAISAAVNATLDHEELLEQLHVGVGEVLDVSTSLIGIYDEATNILSYPVAYDRGRRIELAPTALSQGTNGWAIRNRQPLLLHTYDEALQMGLDMDGDHFGDEGAVEQSFLVAPILFGSRVLGVINIQSYDPRAFDDDDLRFLTTVANQAAVALNNAGLFSETRKNAAEMTTLFEVTQNLSGTLDPDETQQLVADAALRLLGAELCAVIRLTPQGRIERQVLVELDSPRDDLRLEFRLDGMTARLLERGQPIAIADLREVDDSNPDALRIGVRSALGIAVGTQEERLGAIWVGSYEPHEWTEHQISLISILANQAGQVLKGAQLYRLEQQRRRLADTLRDVAQSFTSTLALREIQTLILDQLSRVVSYDSAAVLLRDEGYGNLQITEARGLAEEALLAAEFEVDESPLFGALAAERRPILIADTLLDPRFAPLLRLGWHSRAWVGAPLLVDNELVGILAIGADLPSSYDADDVENTFALANQASQAIQNARLFDQISNLAADLERRVAERTAEYEQASRQVTEQKERLEAVHYITLELTTQLDLTGIIKRALELISNHLGVARGSIMLRDPVSDELICRAVLYGQGDARAAHIPMSFQDGMGLAGWVLQRQEPVNVADVLLDKRWLQEPGRADDVRSVAAVPLKTNDATLGVLVFSSPQVGYFTDSQMNLLGTIAGVVAAALANAQLYSYITDLAGTNAVLLEQQREETSKSDAVLRSVTEGVIVLDTDGTIKLFNPAAETVLEIPAAAMTGQHLSVMEQFGSDETARKRAQAVYNGLLTGLKQMREGQRMYSTSIDLADPNQVIAVNLAPVVDPHGARYGEVAVLRDITREIETDHEKRQFISDVSHELRTPLTAVKGYVDVLLLSGTANLNEDQVSYLGIIKNNTNRLRSLIEDILDFARPDTKKKLNFSPVEMPAVIGEVAQMLRLEYERKGLTVTIDVPPTLPPVMADQKRLTQVLLNLFSNAVKYTYDGGRISVRAYLNRASMLQVEVEDTGVGMTKDQLKKLFRPFYRADNPLRDVAGGTGLGLAIAKQFVEMHGGEMWVQSEQGRGSVFSFIIPLQQNDANDADEDAE
jgi:GAF domain-containing protein/nitrogen-specific signal transduction histidine kinase